MLTPALRQLKERYSITLVGFENALVSVPCFTHLHYFGPYVQLWALLGKFYVDELKKQKLSIVVTMDALGNPLGFASDVKDSLQVFLEIWKLKSY
jgi:vacuolar protein sorting-associated protein 13D